MRIGVDVGLADGDAIAIQLTGSSPYRCSHGVRALAAAARGEQAGLPTSYGFIAACSIAGNLVRQRTFSMVHGNE